MGANSHVARYFAVLHNDVAEESRGLTGKKTGKERHYLFTPGLVVTSLTLPYEGEQAGGKEGTACRLIRRGLSFQCRN